VEARQGHDGRRDRIETGDGAKRSARDRAPPKKSRSLSIGLISVRIGGETGNCAGDSAEERPMKQYLLSIYQPDGPIPTPAALEGIMRDVNALRKEMTAAGAWVFSAGLHPPTTATVVRLKDREVLTTDGPYIEGKEHIGGFTIIRAADLDCALEWGRKLARATTLPVEVRPLNEH